MESAEALSRVEGSRVCEVGITTRRSAAEPSKRVCEVRIKELRIKRERFELE